MPPRVPPHRRSSAPPPSPLRHLPIQFVGSFPDPDIRLDPALPEIAIIGRSNVGKSSLLNALVGRHDLARVSATPGKTTLLNVFRLPSFYLVDLPGYGYARASKAARSGYQQLIRRYLAHRASLGGVVWLLDIRHPPSAEDFRFQEVLASRPLPVLVALTKADKLGPGPQRARRREILLALGLHEDQVELTSSVTGLGIADLGKSILALRAKEES